MPAAIYHIVWTTYGSWLPGDARGWVRSGRHGVQKPDANVEREAREIMAEPPVVLTDEQRTIVDQTIRDYCRIREWTLHAIDVRSKPHPSRRDDRSSGGRGDEPAQAWCSRRLSDAAGLTEPVARKAGRRHWFTEGGNRKLIESEESLENAVRYVMEGQDAKGEFA